MYSVSRRPATRDEVECVGKFSAVSGKCKAQSTPGGPSKLLRSGCAAKSGNSARGCNDSVLSGDSSDELIVRSRSDSVSLALLANVAKKQKASRPDRPDRGFVR